MKSKSSSRNTKANGPNPVDLHVGARVRLRRKFLGMTQEGLADAINLTFQQIQKYERGANRISASKLHEIGKVLKAPAGYFFEGYDDADRAEAGEGSFTRHKVQKFLMTPEGVDLVDAFPRIEKAKHRQQVVALVRALAEDSAEA